MTHKIILDTDPGIDDAMAILFAEAHPAIDLLAITTVFGNATIENGTRNALWLKQKNGMKADVARGAAAPCCASPWGRRRWCTARAALATSRRGGDPHPGSPPGLAIHRRDGEGPSRRDHPGDHRALTNLALALEAAPEVAALVKEVVVMGGAFGVNGHRGNVTPYAEANIHDDPDAADRVFTAPGPW